MVFYLVLCIQVLFDYFRRVIWIVFETRQIYTSNNKIDNEVDAGTVKVKTNDSVRSKSPLTNNEDDKMEIKVIDLNAEN